MQVSIESERLRCHLHAPLALDLLVTSAHGHDLVVLLHHHLLLLVFGYVLIQVVEESCGVVGGVSSNCLTAQLACRLQVIGLSQLTP